LVSGVNRPRSVSQASSAAVVAGGQRYQELLIPFAVAHAQLRRVGRIVGEVQRGQLGTAQAADVEGRQDRGVAPARRQPRAGFTSRSRVYSSAEMTLRLRA